MRIALISDLHANAEALGAVLDRIAAEGVDRIVCLGDIVGYNTDVTACVALLQRAGVLCVAGNHDRAAVGAIGTEGFSGPASRAIAWTRQKLDADSRAFLSGLPLKAAVDDALVLVHGALHPERGCELVRLDSDGKRALSFDALAAHPSGARVCAFGHTHREGVWERHGGVIRQLEGNMVTLRPDALYLLNPGTVGEPRGADSRASFAILDTGRGRVAFHRVAYDRRAALAKTRRAGLAPRFAGVPAPLRMRLIGLLQALGVYEWLKRALPRRASSI
ncbi:putative phosphodiesterase [Azospirillum agricola]|uniref:metallophosphoesterase family protein n=1 Tax=Azospirillum agricola TaxID=1720247 RepID=UPI001AE1D28A|nr:metallophosphoesterase family protein [Azospirillum agricola]MBP2230535.1 putative phosphodiesterase [Azospirillum agricola]